MGTSSRGIALIVSIHASFPMLTQQVKSTHRRVTKNWATAPYLTNLRNNPRTMRNKFLVSLSEISTRVLVI